MIARSRMVVVWLVAVMLAGCSSEPSPALDPEPVASVLTGLVVEVEPASGDVSAFTVETEAGERHEILIDPELDYGFDLGHLREHQVAEDPVRVDVDVREDKPYATAVADA